MQRVLWVILACFFIAGFSLSGCAKAKAQSSGAAIEEAKSLQTVAQKVDYLVGQAKAFYNSKDFQQAIDIAQYVLANLDKDSQSAKGIIEKATADLKKAAQGAMDDVKKKLGGFGQ